MWNKLETDAVTDRKRSIPDLLPAMVERGRLIGFRRDPRTGSSGQETEIKCHNQERGGRVVASENGPEKFVFQARASQQ